jgi:hypothetical protein
MQLKFTSAKSGLRPAAPQKVRSVVAKAGRDLWLPGGDAPAHLDGRLVCGGSCEEID